MEHNIFSLISKGYIFEWLYKDDTFDDSHKPVQDWSSAIDFGHTRIDITLQEELRTQVTHHLFFY